MSNVRLDRLFREEETLADLAIHEPIGHELKNLDLASCRILTELPSRRGRERNHRSVATCAPASRRRLETTAVVAVAVQDLLALGSVHASGIGARCVAL